MMARFSCQSSSTTGLVRPPPVTRMIRGAAANAGEAPASTMSKDARVPRTSRSPCRRTKLTSTRELYTRRALAVS